MNASKNEKRRGFERLEDRQLMAGDVAVWQHDGTLYVRGSDHSNGIAVAQYNSNTFSVTGFTHGGAATKVNGHANGTVYVSGIYNDIAIYGQGGHDWIHVAGTSHGYLNVPDRLYVYAGSGNDYLTINYVKTNDDYVLRTGSGNDETRIYGGWAKSDIHFDGEYGSTHYGHRDTLYVTNTYIGSGQHGDPGGYLSLKGTNGNDRFFINQSTARILLADMYNGNDYLSIRNTRLLAHERVWGGYGTDTLNRVNNFGITGYNPGFDYFTYS